MKKKILVLMALASMVFLTACTGSSSSSSNTTILEKIKKSGVLKVATPGTLFPTSYHNDSGKLTGYEIDMMNEIGKRLGVKVKFTEIGVSEAFTAVDSGQVDVSVNNFDINKERQKKYNMSTPYKYSVGGMIVRADGSSNITAANLSDWSSKKAGGGAGTTYMQIAEKLGAEPVIYDNVTNDVYLRDVSTGRTDFIPNDYYTQIIAVDYITKQYPDIKVKVSNVKYNPTKQGIVMSKDDKSLLTAVNGAIDDMMADNTIKKISEKYYGGQDLTKPVKGADNLPVITISPKG